jgi:xylulokinase
MKQMAGAELTYEAVNELAEQVTIGADGVVVLPYGNGAERVLENRQVGAQISGLNFNRHDRSHLFRAALEGIAFAFVQGIKILKDMGLDVGIMRVGNDNLFQSGIFAETIATLADCQIEIIETTGAVGAAKASGVAVGLYESPEAAMQNISVLKVIKPQANKAAYEAAYEKWEQTLERVLS